LGWFTARGASFDGLTVVSVSYQPPLQPIPSDELGSLVPLTPGQLFDPQKVREAIENLYATGRYREVKVEGTRQDGGVALQLITRNAFFIGRVQIEGVPEPPNRAQLVNATKLTLGGEFRNEDLLQAVSNLQNRLVANGFFDARIDPSTESDESTSQVTIDFRVDPGPRARLTEPVIQGLSGPQRRFFLDRTRWRRFFGLLGWQILTESRVQRGLERARRSFAAQDYLLNRVTLNSINPLPQQQRAQPNVSVELGPKVSVRAAGAKISRSRLRQLVPVYQEQAVDRDLLLEGQRNITEYFQARGYFDTKVSFDLRRESDGRQSVIYQIDPGARSRLVRLDISGNTSFPLSTLRERMAITPASWLRWRRGRFSESLLRSDIDSIRELYQSNGFRDVRVTSRTEVSQGGKAGSIAVSVNVEEGPLWMVARQELAGVSPDLQPAIEQLLSSAPGQPFSESNLAVDRDNVLNYYYNRGFPDAAVDWVVSPAAEPNQVNVRFQITEGERQFVRGFLVSGLKTSDPDMVYERLRLSPGDALSQARLVESQRRLYDLGIFARVENAIQNPEGSESRKFVIYQFEEARKYSLNFGIGAEIARIGGGTPNFDAPAGEAGFSPRASFGLTRTNFLGVGHTVGMQTRLSNIQQRLIGTYLAPQFKGRENLALTVSTVYDVSRDIRTFEGRRLEGSAQLSQKLSRALTLQTRFSYRRNTVRNLAIDDSLVPIYSRPVRVGILSGTVFQDRRDSPVDSTRGYYNSIDIGLASKGFASQTDYLRVLARNSTYHRLARDIVVARSTTLGWIRALGDGGADEIPLPERYFSGGAATHRGFPDNQAGPRDLRTGFPLGGSGLFTNNLELRLPLVGENLGGVLFHDAGNVYSSLRRVSFRVSQRNLRDFDYMVHAAGIGVRYKTPVGPVRVDFAYSPNSPSFQFERRSEMPGVAPVIITQRINRFQFHFSLGQTF
jgi:outer membrane protein assembly complex protein YaeT